MTQTKNQTKYKLKMKLKLKRVLYFKPNNYKCMYVKHKFYI